MIKITEKSQKYNDWGIERDLEMFNIWPFITIFCDVLERVASKRLGYLRCRKD